MSKYVTRPAWVTYLKQLFEIVIFILDKSRNSELENGISYTAVERQWESSSALKVNKLVTTLLKKWPLNVLVHQLESSSSHPLKP